MTESGWCCKCCFKFIITAGFAALFLWLSLRTRKPKCSIESFYIPALNQSLNSSSNSTTLYFDLRLKNQNKDKSVYYDTIYLNFTLLDEARRPVGNLTVPGFHQGRDKKALRKESVEARGVDWKAVSRNGSTIVRLDLATAVRYKILLWKTKRENLRLGTEIKVNGQGLKDNPHGITLNSGAAMPGGTLVRVIWSFWVFVWWKFL
ncbi:protein NDR1-like [Cucumis melo var. makuwa]|uniref:Protein NDR1-like n=2 Tax=Cucumis melo TaxID=3656 RepID=A0A5A7TYN2_CUCMM|nr:protein NDR1-like [Cucumis melo var. makuwa]TYJ97726.1 protein NDR1-like [Cucumis melo var. makuwa]